MCATDPEAPPSGALTNPHHTRLGGGLVDPQYGLLEKSQSSSRGFQSNLERCCMNRRPRPRCYRWRLVILRQYRKI